MADWENWKSGQKCSESCWKNGQNSLKSCWKNGQNNAIQYKKADTPVIYRKIDSYLEYFYRETQLALLLDGARQVGKTTSIRHFGETHFKSFIEINFVRTPLAAELFRNAAGADEIITRLDRNCHQVPGGGRQLPLHSERLAARDRAQGAQLCSGRIYEHQKDVPSRS